MTKSEVLSYLEKRLEILNEQERADILAEFSQHIDNKIAAGLSEEEAIHDFGDIDEFIEDILSAYKVNPEYQQKRLSFEFVVARFLKKFGKMVNAISDEIINMGLRGLLSVLFRFAILVLCLLAVRIPVDMILDLCYRIFGILPDFLAGILGVIANVCLSIVYIVVVCYTVYLFVKKTFLQGYDFDAEIDQEYERNSKYWQEYETEKKTKGKNKKIWRKRKEEKEMKQCDSDMVVPAQGEMEPVCGVVMDGTMDAEPIDVPPTPAAEEASGNTAESSDEAVLNDIKERYKKQAKRAKKAEHKKHVDAGFGGFLSTVFTFCIKALVIVCMLPVLAFALGVLVCFGILVVLMFQGLPVIGMVLAALGLILCLTCFIIFVSKLLLKGNPQE